MIWISYAGLWSLSRILSRAQIAVFQLPNNRHWGTFLKLRSWRDEYNIARIKPREYPANVGALTNQRRITPTDAKRSTIKNSPSVPLWRRWRHSPLQNLRKNRTSLLQNISLS